MTIPAEMNLSSKYRLIALVGPTAVGKTDVALQAAYRFPKIEIITSDSMQVYRYMNIGTAKPTSEEQSRVRHHLLDVVNPTEEYSLVEYLAAAKRALTEITKRGNVPLIVGGTGLYVHGLIDDYQVPPSFLHIRCELEAIDSTEQLYNQLSELDPGAARRMIPSNRRRIIRALEVCLGSGKKFSEYGPGVGAFSASDCMMVGIDADRDELDVAIEKRVKAMLEKGLVKEALDIKSNFDLSKTAQMAIGYREVYEHGNDEETLVDAIASNTRKLCRRQQRWFRRDKRIVWSDKQSSFHALCSAVETFLN